ncbi:MAG: molybdenum cofactor guanylyltransferase [Candidatus Omnitrophica bacterium]|nr:molybdenum cofactor guanylyltransferase [Candidatus Omnitrophota bacterium]MBU1923606.1 molybdenum cofactor guanylyltransferase [Candidatus Omnitrophota bacterium]
MTAIILAGGKASRMHGRDKAFLKINRRHLIEIQLGLLRRYFKEIIIVTNKPDKFKHIKGVKVITDIMPYLGPLGGIYSGLLCSKGRYNFIAACDIPFLSISLIKYMKSKIDKNTDAVVPFINKRYQYLHAIYSKRCIPVLKARLKENKLRVSGLFRYISTVFLTRRQIERLFLSPWLCYNINTVRDLEIIRGKSS